jgi:hypothetical protein
MPQKKRLTLLFGELGQGVPDLVPGDEAVDARRRCRRHAVQVGGVEQAPTRYSSPGRATTIGQDPEKPRVEALAFFVPVQSPMDANERVLDAFLGVLATREEVLGEAEAARVIRANELCEGDLIAFTRGANGFA